LLRNVIILTACWSTSENTVFCHPGFPPKKTNFEKFELKAKRKFYEELDKQKAHCTGKFLMSVIEHQNKGSYKKTTLEPTLSSTGEVLQ